MKGTKFAEYCKNKAGTYETHPFGENPVCFKVGGRIFAQININDGTRRATLKTTPEMGEAYRSMFQGKVVRGYHCPPVQQPYWNSMNYEEMDEEIMFQMIDEAYEIVVTSLPRKEKRRLEEVKKVLFQHVDGENEDFQRLCQSLDVTLRSYASDISVDPKVFTPMNQTNEIHDVTLVYAGGIPVGCAGFRFFDETTAELKRVFMKEEFRGRGLATEMLRRLEADAKQKGYRYMVLETGKPLADSIALYEHNKYKVIDNYGAYKDIESSICMKKKL